MFLGRSLFITEDDVGSLIQGHIHPCDSRQPLSAICHTLGKTAQFSVVFSLLFVCQFLFVGKMVQLRTLNPTFISFSDERMGTLDFTSESISNTSLSVFLNYRENTDHPFSSACYSKFITSNIEFRRESKLISNIKGCLNANNKWLALQGTDYKL